MLNKVIKCNRSYIQYTLEILHRTGMNSVHIQIDNKTYRSAEAIILDENQLDDLISTLQEVRERIKGD